MVKILVAEDDKFLSHAYQVKLSKDGFEVKIATDGREIFELLKTFTPDIILLDLIMPLKDGFSVLFDLKADPQLAKIPVIIASNLGQKEDIDRGMGLGAVDYVVKSDLSLDDLVNKINAHLHART